ncbi:MAG: acyl-CoA carboxylase epsilon subunit [Actinocrinis sp.]
MDERKSRPAVRGGAADLPLPTATAPTDPPLPAGDREAGSAPRSAAITPDGAYTDDVLRIVRGTPNPEELAALVAVLLITRRAREQAGGDRPGHGDEADESAPEAAHEAAWRSARPRRLYTAPGSWAAGR